MYSYIPSFVSTESEQTSWCFSDTSLGEYADSLLGLQSPSSLREWLERESEVERWLEHSLVDF